PPDAAPVAAKSAAPGVDHAEDIGIRHATLSPIPANPIAIDKAIRPDAASALLAPTAVSPLMMTAKDEANPTKAVMTPATIGCIADRGVIGVSPTASRNRDILLEQAGRGHALCAQLSSTLPILARLFQAAAQKIDASATRRTACSTGNAVGPKGPNGAHRSFRNDQ